MLLTKEVEVLPVGKSIKYYKDKGYDVKYRVPIIVRVDDLPRGSGVFVDVLCDYCGKEISRLMYKDYIRRIEKYGNSACFKCKPIKTKENNLKKYGVECTMSLPDVRDKIRQTNIDRYGYECSLQNDKIRQKAINTCRLNYGVDYSIQNKDVWNRTKQSFFDHYGVRSPLQSEELREKAVKTLYKNSSQKASSQQVYICNLYRGILNYPVKYYNVDVYLQDDNISIEYDGGGHNLNVITGRETQEEHDQKEIIRNNVIKRAGYKQMRIISTKDLLPSDDVLLKMLDDARLYFNTYPNHSWIEYDIDNGNVRNAENKDGEPYDFGEFRRVSKSDVEAA